jgi:hypothetical protein
MKKSQAAVEFFMTYGWAIIAVVALIAVLAYYGSNVKVSDKCVFPTSSGLYCDNYEVTNSNITLKLKSSLTEDITISTDSEVAFKGDVCPLAGSVIIESQSTNMIIFSGGGCTSLLQRGRIKSKISLKFTDSTGFLQEVGGTLITKVP